MLNNLHIGTSGWSYPWKGIFYPEHLKSAEYLAYYATRFDCTEINSCFYHYTMPKTIEKWLAETPPAFKFAPKLNREITHERKFVDVAAPLAKFMERFERMGTRLGPVLVQIAASFRYQRPVVENFFKLLRNQYPERHFVLEVRHRSWMEEEPLELMREYGIGFVIASSGGRFPGLEIATSDIIYFRLHGDEKLYDSSYSDEKLERYAFMTKDWLMDGKEVWFFFNNTMRGQAIGDSERLRKMLTEIIS